MKVPPMAYEMRGQIPPGISAETPLVSLAWRAQRADIQRRATERADAVAELDRLRRALGEIGSLAYRFRAAAGDDLRRGVQRVLADVGITIVAPEGAPFTPELMHLLESIAQHPGTGPEPVVAEVVEPAVLHGDQLVRMGKVIVAVPAAAAADASQ